MLNIPLNQDSPLYKQIYEKIRQDILTGELQAFAKLPSSRALSDFLSVSRNTVDIAYDQLVAEGYIESQSRKGYFVNKINQITQFTPNNQEDSEEDLAEQNTFTYDLSPDNVDLEHFPYSVWKHLSQTCVSDSSLFLMGNNKGDLSFRKEICRYLHGSRGVNCAPSQIIIGAGVDYLLQLLSNLLNPENALAMENPAYQRARHIFMGAGYSICDIPVGKDGMDLDSLSQSDSDLCYVTPSHQYPLGTVMPISARQKLLQWAQRKEGRFIIEDDHDSEYRYKGKPIPALQGIDLHGKVIYIGTFSKALAPAIRVGYMVLPLNLLPLFQQKCGFYSCTVSRIDQAILTEFIVQGYFERHLNRMRKIYRNKHDAILRYMKDYNDIKVSGESTGLYLVFQLTGKQVLQNSVKGNCDLEQRAIEKAAKLGIRMKGLFPFYTTEPKTYLPTFLIGYGNMKENEIEKILTLLTSQVLLSL